MTTPINTEISPLLALEHRFVMISLLCRNLAASAIDALKTEDQNHQGLNFYLDSLENMDGELESLFDNIFCDTNPHQSPLLDTVKDIATQLDMANFTPDPTPVPLKKHNQELLEAVPFFAKFYPVYLAAEREKKRLIDQAAKTNAAFETISPNELKVIFQTAAGESEACGRVPSMDTGTTQPPEWVRGQITEYAIQWLSVFNNPEQMHPLTRLTIRTDQEENFSFLVLGQPLARSEINNQPAAPHSVGDYISVNKLYEINPENEHLLGKYSFTGLKYAARSVTTLIPSRFLTDNSFAYRVNGRSQEFILDGRQGRALIIADTNANTKIILSHHFPALRTARYGDAFLSSRKIGGDDTFKLDERVTNTLWGIDYTP